MNSKIPPFLRFITNPLCWVGFIIGLPIPVFVVALHLWMTDRPFTVDSCMPVINGHPVYWVFIFHPIVFAISMGIVGVVLQEKNQKINRVIKKLKDESTHDSLTNLYNRRQLSKIVSRELINVQKFGKDLSMVLVDINQFKLINDTYGHLLGDHVLCTIAHTLEEVVRPYDLLIRWGGDEFMVILPNTNIEQANLVAKRFRAAINAHVYSSNEGTFSVRVTSGIAQASTMDTIETLTQKCDTAFYEAKKRKIESLNYEDIDL